MISLNGTTKALPLQKILEKVWDPDDTCILFCILEEKNTAAGSFSNFLSPKPDGQGLYLEAPEPKYFFRYDIILSTGSLLKSKNDELSPMEYRHHSISSSVRPLSPDLP